VLANAATAPHLLILGIAIVFGLIMRWPLRRLGFWLQRRGSAMERRRGRG
jgi:hypothetical protein